MTKIKLEITLEYDEDIMHGNDESAKDWFYSSVLQIGDLYLHSKEIGDLVGEIKEVKIIP